jgi:hypothetical protein
MNAHRFCIAPMMEADFISAISKTYVCLCADYVQIHDAIIHNADHNLQRQPLHWKR